MYRWRYRHESRLRTIQSPLACPDRFSRSRLWRGPFARWFLRCSMNGSIVISSGSSLSCILQYASDPLTGEHRYIHAFVSNFASRRYDSPRPGQLHGIYKVVVVQSERRSISTSLSTGLSFTHRHRHHYPQVQLRLKHAHPSSPSCCNTGPL